MVGKLFDFGFEIRHMNVAVCIDSLVDSPIESSDRTAKRGRCRNRLEGFPRSEFLIRKPIGFRSMVAVDVNLGL